MHDEPSLHPALTSDVPSELPEGATIILPVRSTVLFPNMVIPLSVGRQRSISAAQEAARREVPLGIIQQRDPSVDLPNAGDLYTVGTLAAILRYVTAPDGSHHVICQGQQRFRVVEFIEGHPFFAARIERVAQEETSSPALEARLLHLRRQAL